MKRKTTSLFYRVVISRVMMIALLSLLTTLAYAQGFPELMYFKFNSLTNGKTFNEASSATRAGSDSAAVVGLTIGGSGQFGAALNGLAGAQATNNVNPAWAGTHTGSWTISFWCNPPTPATTRYYFGNSTGNGTFRCFIGGAAVGIRLTGGVPTMTLDMPAFTPATANGSVITYVYNQTTGTVSGYINGVFQASQTPGTSYPLVGANFWVGSQGTSIEGPMDEFRMYNRALSAAEVLSAANVELFNVPCSGTPVAGNAASSVAYACPSSPFNLFLLGSTAGSGLSYQWEIATDSIGPYTTLLNDTSAGIVKTQTTSNWYRCIVGCSGLFSTSLPVKVVTPTSPLSGTYTLNTTIPVSATNYHNFSSFVTEISCVGVSGPVTMNVAAGSAPTTSNLSFGAIPGTSATNTVTINGNGHTISTNASPIVRFTGTKYVVFNNFNITAASSTFDGFGIHIGGQSQYLTISNNKVDVGMTSTNTTNSGIVISGSTTAPTTAGNNAQYITLTNNEVIGGYYSITAIGNTNYLDNFGHLIQSNICRDFYAYGIYLVNADSSTISNNNIHRSSRPVVTTFYGIYLATSRYLKIDANRIHTPGIASYTAYPFYVTNCVNSAGFETQITNNLVYDINHSSGVFYGLYSLTTNFNGFKIYHNTFDYKGPAANTSAIRGFNFSIAPINIDFKNNIVSITGGGTGAKHCVYVGATPTSYLSDYNDLYINVSGGTNSVGYWTANRTTLADWRTASLKDSNSVSVNPLYLNTAGGNFQPFEVALDNTGTPVIASNDSRGYPRSITTPDIGSYEFSIPVCTSPPPAGKTLTDNATACKGQPFMLTFDTVAVISTGQTYQWQMANDSAGSYAPLANDTNIYAIRNQLKTQWYRVAITCSGLTSYTAPVKVNTDSIGVPAAITIDTALAPSATNYHSMSALLSVLNCKGVTSPVTITYAPYNKTFTENINFGNIGGTSAINTITVFGNGNTIASTSTLPVISFTGTKHVILDSLNVKCLGTSFGVYISQASQHITIRKSKIDASTTSTSTLSATIVASGSSAGVTTAGNNGQYITIDRNELIGGYYSVSLMGNPGYADNYGHTITNNIVRDFYAYGIYLTNADTSFVANNNINRATRATVTTLYGIYLATSRNLKIQKNKLHDFGIASYTAYPFYITNCVNSVGYETEISNNAIYNIGNNGAADVFYGIYSLTTAISGFNIYHNTIQYEVPSGSTAAIRGAFFSVAITNVNFKNNIIGITGGGTGVKTGIYVTTTSASFVSNNNVISINTSNAATNNVGYWTAARVTLADWRTASSQDLQSVSSSPIFSNIATGNLLPLSSNCDNIGAPIAGITTDITNATRSATTPDPGAYEFTGIAGDIAILKGELKYKSACYSNFDTVNLTIKNVIGTTADFNFDPLTVVWKVTGPVTTIDSFVVNFGTLAPDSSLTLTAMNVNMSIPGNYVLNAYVKPNAINLSQLNDTLAAGNFTLKSILSVSPKTITVTGPNDTVELTAQSTLFPGGAFMITEICHNRGTGSPTWPAYHIAVDYIEVTGVPNSDLAGYTLEQWSATALVTTYTFPSGTLMSPNGTAIIAVGQLGASVPSPANFYYHGIPASFTGGFDSGLDPTGRILKNSSGTIVDAVGYSGTASYTFPAASTVTTADWTGTVPSATGTAGIRLTGADVNSATNWVVVSAALTQDPNVLNAGVSTPVPGTLTGFDWNYLGTSFSTSPKVTVGPYTTPGVYTYVASYTNACGTFYDTVRVTAAATVPVKLTTFTATKANADVNLNWNTASEVNNNRFEVERSTNGRDFKTIGRVKGMGTKTTTSRYAFTDEGVVRNTTSAVVYYRLKQVDNDGTFTYSKVEAVRLSNKGTTTITTRPNPSNGTFTIVAEGASSQQATIKVVNIMGATVWSQTLLPNNTNSFDVQLQLPDGMYMLMMEQDGETTTHKLLIQQ